MCFVSMTSENLYPPVFYFFRLGWLLLSCFINVVRSKRFLRICVGASHTSRVLRDAWECSKTQKCILDGAWLRVFVLIDGAPPNKFNALTLVEQHIAISNPELCELLISHWHREHIINVDSTIKDVFRSEIWTLRSRRIYGHFLPVTTTPFCRTGQTSQSSGMTPTSECL